MVPFTAAHSVCFVLSPRGLRFCLTQFAGVVAMPGLAAELRPGEPLMDHRGQEEASKPTLRWLLGVSATSAGEYAGSDRRELSHKVLFALRYGRFKLANSGSSSLLEFGVAPDESGASLDLLASSRWKLRAGLRIGGGQKSSDSSYLAGMPDVPESLLGRVTLGYLITPNFGVTGTLTSDLLGRGNGTTWSNSVDYRQRLGRDTEWRMGIGFTIGNASHMNSFYGVPLSAQTPDRPAYQPGAGLKGAGVGVGFTSALSSRWIAFGGVSYNLLLGKAADSPLTRQNHDLAATVGVAWRCCRL